MITFILHDHSLLQVIFPIQALNPGLWLCRQILYFQGHQGSPFTRSRGCAECFINIIIISLRKNAIYVFISYFTGEVTDVWRSRILAIVRDTVIMYVCLIVKLHVGSNGKVYMYLADCELPEERNPVLLNVCPLLKLAQSLLYGRT